MDSYKRILLKLSGEALAAADGGFDDALIKDIAGQVKTLTDKGIQTGVVIGGGNLWRGRTGTQIDRSKSDAIGMLATVMNCVYVSEVFKNEGLSACVMTPFLCGTFTQLYSKDLAEQYLNEGKTVFFAGGTGHPYFSTDMAMALRAIEMNADLILAAKSVDGVYDSDPKTNPNAKKYDKLSIEDMVKNGLAVIDTAASALLSQNFIPMRLFLLNEEGSIIKAMGESFGGTEITL